MDNSFFIPLTTWHYFLKTLIPDFVVYAPVQRNSNIDYEMIDEHNIHSIIYHTPKPITPLKVFFLPVKENVFRDRAEKSRIIIGTPSCDLTALDILDEIYLQGPFVDAYYQEKRENTLLIGTDCHGVAEHCHCNTSNVSPYPEKNHDVLLTVKDDHAILSGNTPKGNAWLDQVKKHTEVRPATPREKEWVESQRKETIDLLSQQNRGIPSYRESGKLMSESDVSIWKKYAKTCVSCGACATICPTCTCFLLIDRPGLEKIRQMDACQYPGFARIAAGEDALRERYIRFRNRYLCKYVWKPDKFESLACTGCGRCIETCIGKISKNELFVELANTVTA